MARLLEGVMGISTVIRCRRFRGGDTELLVKALAGTEAPVGKVVREAWQKICGREDSAGLGERRPYKTDSAVYNHRAGAPYPSQVDIDVGIE